MAKFGWPQQKSSPTSVGSLKPYEYLPGSGAPPATAFGLCRPLCLWCTVQCCWMEGDHFRVSRQFQVLLSADVLSCTAGPSYCHHCLYAEIGNCLQMFAMSWRRPGLDCWAWASLSVMAFLSASNHSQHQAALGHTLSSPEPVLKAGL